MVTKEHGSGEVPDMLKELVFPLSFSVAEKYRKGH